MINAVFGPGCMEEHPRLLDTFFLEQYFDLSTDEDCVEYIDWHLSYFLNHPVQISFTWYWESTDVEAN